jgi:hypothetical protein
MLDFALAQRSVAVTFLRSQLLHIFCDHLWRAVIWSLRSCTTVTLIFWRWSCIASDVSYHLYVKVDIHTGQMLSHLNLVGGVHTLLLELTLEI